MTKVLCSFTGCSYCEDKVCTKDEISLEDEPFVFCGCNDAEWDEDSQRYIDWLKQD